MLWCDIAMLISVTKTKDDIGDTVTVETEREVFVNKKSIRQSEYYQALSTGLKPEIMLEVKTIDYEDEREVKYNNKRYRVIRTYDRNSETTELVCEAVI